jgi:catechol 2,3-dioxygenase-like lactoylglutathione lyase family enzyme
MQLDHVNIKTDDLEGTTAFYRDVIGLKIGPRPNFPFPGVWLYHETRPVVHLKSPGAPGAGSTGPLDHVAFSTEDLDRVVAALDAKKLDYTLRALPDGSLRQCFVRNPNGIMVEITGV